jgi:hypothetical protein
LASKTELAVIDVLMTNAGPLLDAFRLAFPHVTDIKSLERQLLNAGWRVTVEGLPSPLSHLLVLIPKTRRLDTKHRILEVMVQATEGRELWVLLQQSAIREICLNVIGFYDFSASTPLDPEAVSYIVGSQPSVMRRQGAEVVGAEWNKPMPGVFPAPHVQIAFTRDADRHTGPEMIGSRIIATIRESSQSRLDSMAAVR